MSDHDFQAMTAEERGVYCTLIFYLYCNGGRCQLDHAKLGRITNCNSNFEAVWPNISHKFKVKNEKISHKRVSKELNKSKKRMQVARKSGLKGAEKRWGSHSDPIANESEGKEIEVKENKNTNTDTKASSSFSTNSLRSRGLRFYGDLVKIIRPVNQSDRTCFMNITRWLTEQCEHGKFNEQIFGRVLGYAKEANSKSSHNPAAVFMALMKKELGYKKADKNV